MTENSPSTTPTVRIAFAAFVTMLATMLATVLLVAVAPSASAETGSKADEQGDAPAAIDITRFHVRNGDHRAWMRLDVRDLRQRGVFSYHYWRGGQATPPARSLIVRVRRVEGETRTRFLACGREECAPATCDGLRGSWRAARDEVRVSLPQRCYPRRAGTAPPERGRFFGYGQTATDLDDLDGLLRLDRG